MTCFKGVKPIGFMVRFRDVVLPCLLKLAFPLCCIFVSVNVYSQIEKNSIKSSNAISDNSTLELCRSIEPKGGLNDILKLHRKTFDEYEGKLIGNIIIVVKDIFDESNPRENRALYRFANSIQVNTRESTIRDQLLFKEGDIVNTSEIEESVRILFGREYILDVYSYIYEECGGYVNITIEIRDAWVIEPVFSYGRKGGETSSAIGFRDANFLGSGDELGLVYESNAERNKLIYRYKKNSFLREHWEADFYYADLSDGVDRRFALEKPFYSAKTAWAYGLETSAITLQYNTRYKSEVINEFTQKTHLDSIFWGGAIARKKNYSHRLKVGWTQERVTFKPLDETFSLPDQEEQVYPWVEFERITNNYRRYYNFSYIGRESDVAVGTDFRVRFGVGDFGNSERLYRLIADYSTALSYSDAHFFQLNTSADILHEQESGSMHNSLVSIESRYHYFINGKNKWYAKASYSQGFNLSQYRQLTVGEVEGVRGYPLSYQRGDKRYTLNLERRFYSDSHWFNLIRFGAVIFFDMGRAWGVDDFPADNVLTSVGFGLRIHSSKVGNPSVLHINVGFPVLNNDDDQLSGSLISLSAENKF